MTQKSDRQYHIKQRTYHLKVWLWFCGFSATLDTSFNFQGNRLSVNHDENQYFTLYSICTCIIFSQLLGGFLNLISIFTSSLIDPSGPNLENLFMVSNAIQYLAISLPGSVFHQKKQFFFFIKMVGSSHSWPKCYNSVCTKWISRFCMNLPNYHKNQALSRPPQRHRWSHLTHDQSVIDVSHLDFMIFSNGFKRSYG